MRYNRAILSGAQLVLDGNLNELERLAGFCRAQALGEQVQYDINLALEELFVNAVKHGGCAGMKDAVRIRMELSDGEVRMEFADRGRPFDSSVPARGENGGLGIHLLHQVMREVRYQRDGEWNRVTMRRGGEAR